VAGDLGILVVGAEAKPRTCNESLLRKSARDGEIPHGLLRIRCERALAVEGRSREGTTDAAVGGGEDAPVPTVTVQIRS
jgi:hypothetical protein